jgi:hypothetical protein
MAPPLIPPSPIIIPSGEDSLEGDGGMLAGLPLLVLWLLVCSRVSGHSVAPPSIPPSSMAPPLIPPSPIIVWCQRDSVEEHGGEFAGLILPGGLVWPLIFGLLLNSIVASWSMSIFPLKIRSRCTNKANSVNVTALASMCITS